MQHGVAWQEKVDLQKILQTQKFSLLINESTDIAIQQVLTVVVRYFDELLKLWIRCLMLWK